MSTTSTLTDSRTGATVVATLDDGVSAGDVAISLDVLDIAGAPEGASITGLIVQLTDPSAPALSASGSDVFDSGYFPTSSSPVTCPCNLIVDIGLNGFGDPTGITSTMLNISQASGLSLTDLEGARLFVALHVPGGSNTFAKVEEIVPRIVPEPTTGVLMLLGMMGLAANRRSEV